MLTIDSVDVESILTKYKGNNKEISRVLEEKYLQTNQQAAILGVDIYKYSEYPGPKQLLIPLIFHAILETTVINCFNHSEFFFQNLQQSSFLTEKFIDMGDGGFLIFENPVQAIFFAFFFESNLRIYNSSKYLPEYGDFVGKIELRYALTYDSIHKIRDNHYGASIINNARILAKDKLNRFLFDQNTYEWFLKNYNGIECIRILDFDQYCLSAPFAGYQKNPKYTEPFFMYDAKAKTSLIDAVNVMKVGQIISKTQKLDVYNLFVQLVMAKKKQSGLKQEILISLGNHNVTGIDTL